MSAAYALPVEMPAIREEESADGTAITTSLGTPVRAASTFDGMLRSRTGVIRLRIGPEIYLDSGDLIQLGGSWYVNCPDRHAVRYLQMRLAELMRELAGVVVIPIEESESLPAGGTVAPGGAESME